MAEFTPIRSVFMTNILVVGPNQMKFYVTSNKCEVLEYFIYCTMYKRFDLVFIAVTNIYIAMK